MLPLKPTAAVHLQGAVKSNAPLPLLRRKLPEIVRRWQAFRAEALAAGNARELLSGRPPVGQSISWIRAEVLQIMQVRWARCCVRC